MKKSKIGLAIRARFRRGWTKRMFTAKEKRQLYLVGMMRGHCNAVGILEDWFANVLEGNLDDDAMLQVERMIDAVRVLKNDICDGEISVRASGIKSRDDNIEMVCPGVSLIGNRMLQERDNRGGTS